MCKHCDNYSNCNVFMALKPETKDTITTLTN